MKILALDISSQSTGWAHLYGEAGAESVPALARYGTLHNVGPAKAYAQGEYPWSYVAAAQSMALQIRHLLDEELPDVVVIEETNQGKNRYTQKILEFIHLATLEHLAGLPTRPRVTYVSTSEWRRVLGLYMSKEDRKKNATLRKGLSNGLSKKEIGIRGKVTSKHVTLRWVNEVFGLALRPTDNDIADAIAVGAAFCRGAKASIGDDRIKKPSGDKSPTLRVAS